MVGAIGHEERGLRAAGKKDRRDHGDVGQVRSAAIGIVEQRDVAGGKMERIETACTDMGMEPRWTGMSSPMAMRSPSAEKTAEE